MNHINIANAVLSKEKLYVEKPETVPLALLMEQWQELISVPEPVTEYTTVAEAAVQVVKASHAILTLHKLFPKDELSLEDPEMCRRSVGTFQMAEGVQEIQLSWNHDGNEKWTAIFPSDVMAAGRPETAFHVVGEAESLAEVCGLAITAARKKIERGKQRVEPASAPEPGA